MRVLLIACAFLCCAAAETQQVSPRSQRQFSLFSVVQFDNVECQSSDATSSTPKGVCYTATECTDRKGVNIGNCAQGFGVCCMVKTSECGSTVSQNCSYVQNPSFPTVYSPTAATNCQYNVKPLSTSKILPHTVGLSKKSSIFVHVFCIILHCVPTYQLLYVFLYICICFIFL